MITASAPVTVITTSAVRRASSRPGTAKPSRLASSLVTGSISTTETDAHAFRKLAATPFPHAPYPKTATWRPLVIRLVMRRYDSSTLWPTACRFSANCLIGLSLMTRTGTPSRAASGRSRIRPEVVSSVPPSNPG